MNHLIEAEGLCVEFPAGPFGAQRAVALENASLTLSEGESLGIVGPSASGKTTLALACAGLLPPTKGRVCHEGVDVFRRGPRWMRQRKFVAQMVFQNPFAALNPRRTIGAWLSKIIRLRTTRESGEPIRAEALLDLVGLPASVLSAFPSRLSGGECQRACLAGCLAGKAKAIILDEPLSMLDSISQDEITKLLRTLREKYELAYLAVSHDLSFVDDLCERVMVLSEGCVVESGQTADVFHKPNHPVTRALLDAY